jgi:hypothetical protein
MRYFTNQTVNPNGNTFIENIPWTVKDYEQAIIDLEYSITPRRFRESVLTEEGKAWLENIEAEIQTLRNEMSQLIL